MPRSIDRRTVLRATGAATLGAAVAGSLSNIAAADPDPAFAHGVASGDPLPNYLGTGLINSISEA